MPQRTPGLTIEPIGDEWILRRTSNAGKTTGIKLSDGDILTMVAHGLLLQGHIGPRLNSPQDRHQKTIAFPEPQIDLTSDILASMLLVTATIQTGVGISFAFSMASAQGLADAILQQLNLMRSESQTRQ